MKYVITENQYKYILKENGIGEESRNLSAKQKNIVYNAGQDLARDVYGDDFEASDEDTAERYDLKGYTKDANIKGGLFSVGNAKLSPDTLIINFTSAFGCPSAVQCPISQAACYAVAGENRLADTRSKNVKVHKLLARCYGQKKLGRFFQIAELYINLLKDSDKPIKWIRFNEAGDFPNQEVLDAAAQFARDVETKYGVKCMAYTARGDLNFSNASQAIAINASTNKVLNTIDANSPKRNFFGVTGTTFDYDYIADAEENKVIKNLENNPDAEEVSDNVLDKLTINGTLDGDITTPILQYGKWGQGEEEQGYYYVCPCSFWKDRKDQIEIPYCKQYLDKPPYTLRRLSAKFKPTIVVKNGKEKKKDHPIVDALKKQLNKVKSPCGVVCAVCHDRNGGVDKETGQRIKDYAVLTGIHGSTGQKYNPLYARIKRSGEAEFVANYCKQHLNLPPFTIDNLIKQYGEDSDVVKNLLSQISWSDTNKNGRWNNPGGKGKYGTIPIPNEKG